MLDSSGAEAKAARVKELLTVELAEAFVAATQSVIAVATANTPTPSQEYNILMEGEGGISSVPMGSSGSLDADGRKRLIKDESTYLAEVVPSPADYQLNIDSTNPRAEFYFGRTELLRASTYYSYKNADSKQGEGSTVTKGPYFDNWMSGSEFEIHPVFIRRGKGTHFYPLRPDETTKHKVMVKRTRGWETFSPTRLNEAFRAVFEARLRAISPDTGH